MPATCSVCQPHACCSSCSWNSGTSYQSFSSPDYAAASTATLQPATVLLGLLADPVAVQPAAQLLSAGADVPALHSCCRCQQLINAAPSLQSLRAGPVQHMQPSWRHTCTSSCHLRSTRHSRRTHRSGIQLPCQFTPALSTATADDLFPAPAGISSISE